MGPAKLQNVVLVLQNRERGMRTNRNLDLYLQRVGEEKAACSEMEETHCKLPTSVRSTFLMSFSPDSTKVASTHGDHKIYVCDVKTGNLLHKLEGHPRTPWCLAFHPTSNDILASGCLGGEVRVWHLRGGSEKWGADHHTVITSLAFHPLDKVLVIATYNQIHFWDWSLSEPFATCSTKSEREKVRFVKFDMLGHQLITGIANVIDSGHIYKPGQLYQEGNYSLRRRRHNTPLPGNNQASVPDRTPVSYSPGSSQRRSLLSRLMTMYQHIEGLEETQRSTVWTGRPSSPVQNDALNQARHYAEAITLTSNLQRQLREDDTSDRLRSEPSTSRNRQPNQNAANNNNSSSSNNGTNTSELSDSDEEFLVRAFWRTFHRLRFYCTSLERRVQQLQETAETQAGQLLQQNPVAVVEASSSAEDVIEPSQNANISNNSDGNLRPNYRQVTAEYLINVLTRLRNSLQFSDISSAVAQEQIQQLQLRVSEILERLTNVTGYRVRLTTLREQLYEVAERNERRGDEMSPVRSLDLAHCLWLIEMSLKLTQQMQRILHADYRLTQLHINTSSQATTSGASSENSNNRLSGSSGSPGSSRNCAICGNQGAVNTGSSEDLEAAWDRLRGVVRRELEALTERFRSNLFNELSPSANTEGRAFHVRNSNSSDGHSSSVWQPLHTLRPLMDHVSDRGSNLSQSQTFEARTLSETSDDEEDDNNDNNDDVLNRENRTPLTLGHRPYLSWRVYRNRVRNENIRISDSSRGTSLPSTSRLSSNNNLPQSNLHVPEVNIVLSSSSSAGSDTEPLPLHERPRSPPLSTILSGGSDPSNIPWYQAIHEPIRSNFVLHETANTYFHRIQSWDFSRYEVPEISNAKANVVVSKCKIHNDASIDISKDGQLLVALVPSSGIGSDSVMFAVYSLKPKTLGQCLYTWAFDSNAISVSFSPLGQYIVVGLATPRLYLNTAEKEAVAQIFKLKYVGHCCIATHVRSLTQQSAVGNHHPGISLNSVQWLPQPGQGLIYGTNRGCLCICKPVAPMSGKSSRNWKVPRHEINQVSNFLIRQRSIMNLRIASTQTVEPETQTTGTQTFGTEGSSSSSSR